MTRRRALAWLLLLARMEPEERRRVLATLPRAAWLAIIEEWWWQAHGGQHEPEACASGDPWRVWAIVAGRGFGKTRAGAEWVWARARAHPGARIALVAASLEEVARVMVEGESGLLAIARCDEAPRWVAGRGEFHFPSGAVAFAYSAVQPSMLRGPQHDFAWCDELAKWGRGHSGGNEPGGATWDNLMLGLRLGAAPRTIVTTTPKPMPLLKRILALERCAATHGRTQENRHLPGDYLEAVTEMYGGTRLGRQELDGLLLEDVEGALWTRDMLEASRQSDALPRWERVVIGVDPPASANGDACGIMVCGLGADGIAYVLADCSVKGLRPEGWARRVAAAAADWQAQLVVAEQNQGGDMVGSVLRGVEANLPVRLVSATKSKAARAEPVALRFETGKAKLAGRFPELEEELAAITYAGYEGPSNSPDRADAMVWAMSELLKPQTVPRIRML